MIESLGNQHACECPHSKSLRSRSSQGTGDEFRQSKKEIQFGVRQKNLGSSGCESDRAAQKGRSRASTGNSPSPHTEELIRAFLGKFGGTKYFGMFFNTQSVRRAAQLSYGSEVVPRYHFDRARYILSIDGTF